MTLDSALVAIIVILAAFLVARRLFLEFKGKAGGCPKCPEHVTKDS